VNEIYQSDFVAIIIDDNDNNIVQAVIPNCYIENNLYPYFYSKIS
jgi:hypothetical protein